MIIVGIDPGTGKSSPTGVAIISVNHKGFELLETHAIESVDGNAVAIAVVLEEELKDEKYKFIFIETFVMQGKAGQMLNQMIGMFHYIFRNKVVKTIHTMTVKKIVSGTGKADKKQVAEGVLSWKWDKDSQKQIKFLIKIEAWDQTDAIAIAIAGLKEDERKANEQNRQ